MITLITEPNEYSEKALTTYRLLGPVYFLSHLKNSERDAILAKTNILVVRLKYKFDESWFTKMTALKVIATPTTGLNHIDLDEAKKRGINIISLRGQTGFLKYITSTAEEALGLTLALAKNIPGAFDDVKQNKWNRDAWKGRQLAGKTFGILGCGRLGKIVAKYAHALRMSVIGSDPHVSERMMMRYGIEKVSMNTLFKKSDILSIHVLLTDETKNLVKEKHFKMMKPESFFINTARAEIIEENALYQALKNKWIAGAAIDVMWNESSDGLHLKTDPIFAYAKNNKNLIIVPHIGGATYEAMAITEDFIAKLVVKSIQSNRKKP